MVIRSPIKSSRRRTILTTASIAESRLFGKNGVPKTQRDRQLVLLAEQLKGRLSRKQDLRNIRSLNNKFRELALIDKLAAKKARRIFSNNGVGDLLSLRYRQERGTLRRHHLEKIEAIKRLPKTRIP